MMGILITLRERIEEIASMSKAREVYTQYLYMLLQHIEVIKLVNDNCDDKRSVQLLAETYAVASIASNGDHKDQVMFDILREIAYQTAINKEHVVYKKEALSFVLANAYTLIKTDWNKQRKFGRDSNINI